MRLATLLLLLIPMLAWISPAPSAAQTCRTLIAFTSSVDGDDDLYVANPDGSSVTQITDDSSVDSFPTWSPDGSEIAFISDRDGEEQIYSLTLATGLVRRLTTAAGVNTEPSWSPDGERIAYISRRNGDWDLYTIRPDGTDEQRVTDSVGDEVWPDWSPDGRQIAFASRPFDRTDFTLDIMDVTSGNTRTLVELPGNILAPRWLPSGEQIAFDFFDGTWDIYVADAITGDAEALFADPEADEYLITFSPDGTQAAHVRLEGSYQIFVTDFAGGETRIGDAGINNVFPAWSPCLAGLTAVDAGTTPAIIPAEVACKANTLTVLDLTEQPEADSPATGILRAGQSALVTEGYTDGDGALWWLVQTSLPVQRGWLRADTVTTAGRCAVIPQR